MWLVFMTEDYTEEQFFQSADITFDTILLTASGGKTEYSIREVFRVTPTSDIKVAPIGVWTQTAGLRISFRSIYHRRSDLNGLIFRAGTIEVHYA